MILYIFFSVCLLCIIYIYIYILYVYNLAHKHIHQDASSQNKHSEEKTLSHHTFFP